MRKQANGPLINQRYKRGDKLGQGADSYVYKVEDTQEKDPKFKL